MKKQEFFTFEQLLEIVKKEVEKANRPANEIILDDVDVRLMLKVSPRTVSGWRSKAWITYSKVGGKLYYLLSDILDFLKKHANDAID